MNWLANLKVSTKLIGGFLIVALIGAIIGLVGINKAGAINDMGTTMYERDTLGLRHTAEANMHLLAAGRAVRSAILSSNLEDRNRQLDVLQTRLDGMHKELDQASGKFVTPKGKALVADTQAAAKAYEQAVKKVAATLRTESIGQERASVTMLFGEARTVGDKADDLMTNMVELKLANAAELSREGDEVYTGIRLLLISLTVGGLLVGLVIGVLVSGSLTRQLGGEPAYAATVASSIAAGDLTIEVQTRPGDHTSLLSAMKAMQESLVATVSNIRQSSDTIATASGEIAAGNQDLSSRTEQQASSLEETAASMEELTSTVKQNADNARQANQLAETASSVALRGGTVVSLVVGTMGSINESSRKIVDIIGVIDGIAFQTNILALNAAVEAARAGEQGRGFAVVAAEVRNLAQRSAAAAKEIKTLIGDSVDKVEEGSRQVAEAGKTMEEIVGSVKRVTDIMAEITAASQEQTQGIEQINQAIAQMDQVTQQNAALVEEAAAAAASLQEQAGGLTQVVSTFRVDQGRGFAAKAVAARPVASAKVHRQPAAVRPALAARKRTDAPARPMALAAAGGAGLASAAGEWEEF